MLVNEHFADYKILSPDKNQVSVRLVHRGDLALIQKMHERLSQESIYYRYLSANKPTTKDLENLCNSDSGTAVVLVATIAEPEEKVIGIAYYLLDRQDPSSAEPAILVEDDYQGCGLGKQLISTLYQYAVENGLKSFNTTIHPGNQRVLQMIKGSGLCFENKYCEGVKEIRIWLSSKA
jgi:GNAT superfamily N-acetyltransferase